MIQLQTANGVVGEGPQRRRKLMLNGGTRISFRLTMGLAVAGRQPTYTSELQDGKIVTVAEIVLQHTSAYIGDGHTISDQVNEVLAPYNLGVLLASNARIGAQLMLPPSSYLSVLKLRSTIRAVFTQARRPATTSRSPSDYPCRRGPPDARCHQLYAAHTSRCYHVASL